MKNEKDDNKAFARYNNNAEPLGPALLVKCYEFTS